LKTRPAKHWPALGRLKGDGGLHPAFRAGRPGFGANPRISTGALGFALFTTLGVVFELLIVEEELLTRRKDEVSAAVNTLEDSIREFHGRLPNRGAFRSGYDFSEHAVPVPVFVCPNNGPGPHLTRRH